MSLSVRGVAFDFNGTLSDDEPILCAVYAEMFAELGRPMSEREYYSELAGRSDEEIMRRWLGRDDAELVAERVRRYRDRVQDGSTIDDEARAAVRFAAAHGRAALVSSAMRSEIEQVIASAGLRDVFDAIVAAEDVGHSKPDPEPYLQAARLLEIPPQQIVAFEDTEAGVSSAKGAGMHVVALSRTVEPDRLAAADELIPRLTVEHMRRLVG